ncbi:BA75_00543T0 [Komagataella pastoris]|uniref:BA75_00543T0 n=1 Tax=Komagataella pastoris TaxID=4922 RepID=A0A1B2J5P1_PICPA|nr:BA75_00543T0 [Komagataella pastoris]
MVAGWLFPSFCISHWELPSEFSEEFLPEFPSSVPPTLASSQRVFYPSLSVYKHGCSLKQFIMFDSLPLDQYRANYQAIKEHKPIPYGDAKGLILMSDDIDLDLVLRKHIPAKILEEYFYKPKEGNGSTDDNARYSSDTEELLRFSNVFKDDSIEIGRSRSMYASPKYSSFEKENILRPSTKANQKGPKYDIDIAGDLLASSHKFISNLPTTNKYEKLLSSSIEKTIREFKRLKEENEQLKSKSSSPREPGTRQSEELVYLKDVNKTLMERLQKQKDSKEQLTKMETELKVKDDSLKSLGSQLVERDQLVDILRAQLADKEKLLENSKRELAEKDHTIEDKDVQLSEKDQLIEKIKSELLDTKKVINEKENTSKTRNSFANHDLNSQVPDKQSTPNQEDSSFKQSEAEAAVSSIARELHQIKESITYLGKDPKKTKLFEEINEIRDQIKYLDLKRYEKEEEIANLNEKELYIQQLSGRPGFCYQGPKLAKGQWDSMRNQPTASPKHDSNIQDSPTFRRAQRVKQPCPTCFQSNSSPNQSSRESRVNQCAHNNDAYVNDLNNIDPNDFLSKLTGPEENRKKEEALNYLDSTRCARKQTQGSNHLGDMEEIHEEIANSEYY